MIDGFISAEKAASSDRPTLSLARGARPHLHATGVAILDTLMPALLNANFGAIILALITFGGGVLYGVLRPAPATDTSSIVDASMLTSGTACPLEGRK
jgi:hypothetical protein